METPCLNNINEYPDDEVLIRHLGNIKKVWDSFIEILNDKYPSFSTEWRFYNDGKSWLFKITKKTKTICWVAVYNNYFRTTFYFSDKAEDLILNSTLSQDYKDTFVNGKKYGKIKAITVVIKEFKDLEMIKILIEIKEKLN
jgi:hypothetical protein